MVRTQEQILADLGKLIAEDSPHGAALRVEVATAVHRMAAHQPTAWEATHMQKVSAELLGLHPWKRNGKKA
jgi:uncharacterized coiled-coil protein SlyX